VHLPNPQQPLVSDTIVSNTDLGNIHAEIETLGVRISKARRFRDA
jgi:hypothetical protein